MQVVITQEMVGRDKQKRVQEYLGEARKQISSRRFTGALEVLEESRIPRPRRSRRARAHSAGVFSGQQQEKRRQDLERLTAQIEEALVKEDYKTASARIQEGLAGYPEDRGLLKLQAVVRKQRDDTEKSLYIEQQTSQARRLLDGGQEEKALALLQSALEKYPAEPSLKAMVVMVEQNLERTRKEQEKTEVLQSAREAIRRKAYSIAIAILKAASEKTSASEFDELLQFAQNEAENQAKRQKIDTVADEARRLTAEDKYPEAIALLDATLQEIPDQELQIILADIMRHVDEFNAGVDKAITTAERLVRQDRYAEAIKVLEGQSAQYGKAPKFHETLESIRQRQQAVHAVSVLKEEVRNALSNRDIARAKQLCEEFRKSENAPDITLLEKEIETKQTEAANARTRNGTAPRPFAGDREIVGCGSHCFGERGVRGSLCCDRVAREGLKPCERLPEMQWRANAMRLRNRLPQRARRYLNQVTAIKITQLADPDHFVVHVACSCGHRRKLPWRSEGAIGNL